MLDETRKEKRHNVSDFERVKQSVSLSDFMNQYARKDKGGKYCCPICGSGTHGKADSDGDLSIMPSGDKWQCFACGAQGDVFDIAGALWGIEDRKGQLEAVARWGNVPTGNDATVGGERFDKPTKPTKPKDYVAGRIREEAYVERMRGNIDDPAAVSYLSARGLPLEDAKAFGLGYDPDKRRIVIPWKGCSYYHIDRAIDEGVKPKYLKPKSDDVGAQPLYNLDAVEAPAYFVVEGVLDALAVELCGFEAVAVASNHMSASNLSELVDAIKAKRDAGVAVIMMDGDDGGEEGTVSIYGAFKDAGISSTVFMIPDVEGGDNDPMGWYKVNRDGMRECLEGLFLDAVEYGKDKRERQYLETLKTLRVLDPADVAANIATLSECEEPTPTGIRLLDDVLDGGMRSGLCTLGAVSSMGKTTLSVQVADYMAAHGRGVLFVTIEQSAREIVAKSLSRMTRELNPQGWNTVTSTEIISPSKRARWNDEQGAAFMRACEAYAETIAPRLRVLECSNQPKVDNVRAIAEIMAEHDGQAPAIFIDYLQLMAPIGERDTDKQAVDKNVMALRQLARDLKTPIWAVSSLNRAAYSEGVMMDAFKESGAIEYGSDVLIGLQPRGMAETVSKMKDTRVKRESAQAMRQHKGALERECELVILKNRNGATPSDGLPLIFYPLSALYVEGELDKPRRVVL